MGYFGLGGLGSYGFGLGYGLGLDYGIYYDAGFFGSAFGAAASDNLPAGYWDLEEQEAEVETSELDGLDNVALPSNEDQLLPPPAQQTSIAAFGPFATMIAMAMMGAVEPKATQDTVSEVLNDLDPELADFWDEEVELTGSPAPSRPAAEALPVPPSASSSQPILTLSSNPAKFGSRADEKVTVQANPDASAADIALGLKLAAEGKPLTSPTEPRRTP